MKYLATVLLLLATPAFAADQPAAITTQQEFGDFMEGYYKNPRPDQVESAMRYIAGPGSPLMTGDSTSRMMQTSFACLFRRHPDKRDEWKKVIQTLPDTGHKFLNVAMESSVEAMFMATPIVPEKNDMSWGCFFITGDTSYVQDVVLAMKHLDERKDLKKFLTGASAQWSLCSISLRDDKVRGMLQAAAKGTDPQLAAAAQQALSRPPGELRESMLATLREQKKAGVW
jgi:hypothetical protein